MRRAVALAVAAVTAGLAAAAPAAAAPDCVPGRTAPKPLLTGQAGLESVIVDGQGRLLYTDQGRKALMVLDAPGTAPRRLAPISEPGGLALDGAGGVLVGEGNALVKGVTGNLAPAARLVRVDLQTGARTTYAEGLQMANGVARHPDGTVFASNDLGLRGIDRVGSGGTVQTGWSPVLSANGLAVSPGGGTLYAAQTFVPATIAAIPLSNPSRPYAAFRAGLLDIAAGLDGLAIDGQGRLVAAAWLAGQVWRVSGGKACVLAKGLDRPAAVAVGQGPGPFGGGKVIVVTHGGTIAEVPA